MVALETRRVLDRAIEACPNTEEMAERRRRAAAWRVRSCAVLLAYAKRSLERGAAPSALPDDPYLERDLRGTSRRRWSSASATLLPSTRCGAS